MSPVPPGIAQAMVAAGGRVTFARFMQLALTDPTEGYYVQAEPVLGRSGHFSTAPILSPDFNRTVARLVEELVVATASAQPAQAAQPAQSDPSPVGDAPAAGEALAAGEAGESARIHVVEAGGGEGQLAEAVLARWAAENPWISARAVYTIAEVGEALCARQRSLLAPARTEGWRVDWAPSLGAAVTASQGRPLVVIGNEFLDALPVHLVDVRGDTPLEAWVEVASDRPSGLREVFDELSAEAVTELLTLFGTQDCWSLRRVSSDGFLEVRPAVGDLFRDVGPSPFEGRTSLGRGVCLLTIDYGEWFGADEQACDHSFPPGGADRPVAYHRTLRGYYRHQVVDDPYARVGAQDLTADVDFAALHVHGCRNGFETVLYTTAAEMLRGDGGLDRLARLEEEAKTCLQSDRHATVLRALLDDEGVGGAFKVMLQVRG